MYPKWAKKFEYVMATASGRGVVFGFGVCCAQVGPVAIGTDLFAGNCASAFALDGNAQVGAELLFFATSLAQVADRRFTRQGKLFLRISSE